MEVVGLVLCDIEAGSCVQVVGSKIYGMRALALGNQKDEVKLHLVGSEGVVVLRGSELSIELCEGQYFYA